MQMIEAKDLPSVIPIFPLAGAILLPRARLPLHIFENRYVAMIDDCLKSDARLIGMIQPYGDRQLHKIGCAGRLTGFSETDDGRYMITLSAVSRFHLCQDVGGSLPYRCAEVEWKDFSQDLVGAAETDLDFDRQSFLALLERYLKTHDLSTDWGNLRDANPELLIHAIAMLCPFAPEEKQAVLEAPTLAARRGVLTTVLQFALRGGDGGRQ